MQDRRTDIEAINDLIETLIDSVNGYEEAADVAKDPSIKASFHQLAQERRSIVRDFQSRVSMRGGEPEESGSFSAAAHRSFMNLRSLFQSDTKAAIAEVERGENILREHFETVLTNDRLDPEMRTFINSVYDRIRLDHSRWDSVKRALEAAS
ncbi:PA2169 family four-helix-bundle protein [Pedomonas sp. V897]|uniref:PA2169 family four-helix-bundle protein n=1 Tax=Pedomonas sp. V897 TaxID=3446482 RepID=UPI003EE1D45B